MQKPIWLLGVLGAIFVALLGILIFMPAKQPVPQAQAEGIHVTSIKANDKVSFPVEISGYIDGKDSWVGFEGQVGTVNLIGKDGIQVSSAVLTATTDWMKFPTEFKIVFDFSERLGYIPEGTLVFHNENPSGDPTRDRTFLLPIVISPERNSSFKVYFSNNAADSTCDYVVSVKRIVPETKAIASAAITELLKGPTDEEKKQGYSTSIPVGSKLNSISIVNGEARVDFNSVTESGGGSCSMAARVAQITETLKQFSTITSVEMSINGRTGDIFQP